MPNLSAISAFVCPSIFQIANRRSSPSPKSDNSRPHSSATWAAAAGVGSAADVLAGLAGGEPTPAAAAEVAEECGRLLALLGDGDLRRLAIWKMEGHTNAEIAAKLGKSVPTVERKLTRIRQAWERETQP